MYDKKEVNVNVFALIINLNVHFKFSEPKLFLLTDSGLLYFYS